MMTRGNLAVVQTEPTAGNAPRICAYTTIEELDALRPAWEKLLAEYPAASTFSTWEWLTSWWRSFARKRQLLALAFLDSESLLIGLALLSISVERFGLLPLRVLRLMGDGSNDSDNLDVPVRPGMEKVFVEALLRYLQRHKNQWDACLLNTMPADSPATECMLAMLRSSQWTSFEYSTPSSAVILPETWDQYEQQLFCEDRNNLERYARRLKNRYRARFYRCATEDQLPRCLEALFRLHQERWRTVGGQGSFSSEERRAFYYELSRHLLARGWLELWVLELNGEIAAVQYAFRYRHRVFQLQEGYDPRRSSDRPGFLLRGEVLKQLIAEGVRFYDFLGGADVYKSRWCARPGHYRNLHFAPTLSLGAAYLALADRADKSRQWLRNRFPSPLLRMVRDVRKTVEC